MEEQEERQQVAVKVLRTDIDTHQYVVSYGEDAKLYRIPMLPYQRKMPEPDTIPCLVERSLSGGVYIRQDFEALIRGFYQEGDVTDFTVQRSYGDDYILQESHGFTARLAKKLIPNPALTPCIGCRIKKIKGRYMQIEPAFVDNKKEATSFSLTNSQLQEFIGQTAWNQEDLRNLLLGNTPSDLFDAECHQWIAGQAAQCPDREMRQEDLKSLKSHLLQALESSEMLNLCDDTTRKVMEERFSDVIEQAGYYLDALDMVAEDGQPAADFVTTVLEKLSKSSYVYHPRKRLYIMLSIFHLDFNLMEEKMDMILSIIRKHSLKLSKREPFCKMWIILLEYYIHHIYETPDRLNDRKVMETMIMALALQMNLAEDFKNDLFDDVLNRSLLYRLCSRMNVTNPDQLLEESLFNVVSESGDQSVYVLNTDDAALTANLISNQVSDTVDGSLAPAVYSSDRVHLSIENGKVTLSAPDVNDDNEYDPLPAQLNLWHNLSIRLSERPSSDLRGDKSNTVRHYKLLWDFIYKSFFSVRQRTKKKSRRPLYPGDKVDIIVRQKMENGLIFLCQVVDQGYEDVVGYIDAAKDIVPYYPGKLTLSDFYKNGAPLELTVKIDQIEDDGSCHFVMNDLVIDFMDDYRINHYGYTSHLNCCLNTPAPGSFRVPAISFDGLSVSVSVERGTSMSVLTKGKVVEVTNPERGPVPYMNVTYVRDLPEINFSVSNAFHQLMINYADGLVYQPEEEKKTEEEKEETLTTVLDDSRVYELMNIIETYAGFEDDYVKAYNYISTCRVLARMISSKREDYYVKRLTLLELLSDFAQNSSFTDESLRILDKSGSDTFNPHSNLYQEYQQMRVVSWLNTDEHNDELYQMSCDRTHPVLQQLAALVMSHNTVKKAGLIPQAEEILEKIRSILKLRRQNVSDKKNYGKESYLVEFKTSIVYPEYSMRPNLFDQTRKILSEICAFLNADGGTLYLGVNDQGTEMGVEEDLHFQQFNGSADHYEVYVNNMVASQMSQEAAHHVHTHWDDDPKVRTKVLVIEVTPSPDPISLNGEYYERMGTSSRRVNEEYLPVFLANRRKWAAEHQMETREQAKELFGQLPQQNTVTMGKEYEVRTQNIKDKIQTSRIRNNVINDWEEEYYPVINYICFIDQDEYKVLDENDYKTDDYRLELAVHEDEQDYWLLMAYADGSLIKTRVAELLNRGVNRVFKRYSSKELIYANIVCEDDIVVVGYIDGKGNHYVRFNTMDMVEEGSMQEGGSTLCSVNNQGVHYVETLHRKDVPDWVTFNPKATTLGTSLKTVNGKKMKEFLPGCK